MADMVMPFIVLNMGSEMVYILHQRLEAQKVSDPKSHRVLTDVVRAMFSEIFIAELFQPQEMYSNPSAKQIFEKLAHSSIMRLNKSSMDKLYDLMTMGFKYQILSCTSPVQLLNVTLVHLESLKVLCLSSVCNDLVDACISTLIDTYSRFTDAQWLDVKFELLKFMQGKKVKVSLFLQQEMQMSNGELTVTPNKRLPYRAEQPGKILWFERGAIVGRQNISLPWPANPNDLEVATTIIDPLSTVGKNMYLKDATENLEYTKDSFERCIQALNENAPYSSTYGGSKILPEGPEKKFTRPRVYDSKVSAKAELSLLSDLLGGTGGGGSKSPVKSSAKSDSGAESKPLRLNLFPSSGFSKENDDGEDEDEYNGTGTIIIDIDGTSDTKTIAERMRDLDFNDDSDGDLKAERKAGSDVDDDDDLLALMDSAK